MVRNKVTEDVVRPQWSTSVNLDITSTHQLVAECYQVTTMLTNGYRAGITCTVIFLIIYIRWIHSLVFKEELKNKTGRCKASESRKG